MTARLMICRAAPVTASLGPGLTECPRLSPARAMLVTPVVSTLGGSRPPVAPAVSASALAAAHRPSVAPAVSTPQDVSGAGPSVDSVPAAAYRPLFFSVAPGP